MASPLLICAASSSNLTASFTGPGSSLCACILGDPSAGGPWVFNDGSSPHKYWPAVPNNPDGFEDGRGFSRSYRRRKKSALSNCSEPFGNLSGPTRDLGGSSSPSALLLSSSSPSGFCGAGDCAAADGCGLPSALKPVTLSSCIRDEAMGIRNCKRTVWQTLLAMLVPSCQPSLTNEEPQPATQALHLEKLAQ